MVLDVLNGVSYGFIASLFLGHIFIVTISEAIIFGKLRGYLFSLGALFSDILVLVAIFWGVQEFFSSKEYQLIMGMIGIFILFILGIMFIISKPIDISFTLANTMNNSKKKLILVFLKGFTLNIFNPFPPLTWLALLSTRNDLGSNLNGNIIFIISMLLTMSIVDIIKVLLADHIRAYVSQKILNKLKIFVGLTLIGLSFIIGVRILL